MKLKYVHVLAFLLGLIAVFSNHSVHSATVPAAKPDQGLVVFYRLKKAKGKAMRFQISDSSARSIGDLSNGSMFHIHLDPGQHTFDVRAPSVDGSDLITLDVVAGETYYVQGEILWGWPAGRPKFSNV